jgi:hypothetical protein
MIRLGGLLRFWSLARASRFHSAFPVFLGKTLLFHLARRMCWHAAFWDVQRPLQKLLEAFNDFHAVTMLAASSLRAEVEDTTAVDISFETRAYPGPFTVGETWGLPHVEGQLNLCGGAIDMLPPRAATTAELKMQLGERDGERLGDSE